LLAVEEEKSKKEALKFIKDQVKKTEVHFLK